MIRGLFILLGFLSPFLFPYPAIVLLSFVAALYVPLLGLFVGILTDLLYYVPDAGMPPYATLIGLLVTGLAFFVRRFVKARIIGG